MSLTYDKNDLRAKGQLYCGRNDTSIASNLGFGTQGMVFKTARNSAIKVYSLETGYVRERDVYRRLQDRNIQSIQGFVIPRIANWDDTLLVFEMSVVSVPCILDFGGAYLDNPPPHMRRDQIWLEDKETDFGSNWPMAQSIIRELEYRGDIWLSDVNSNNIKFPSA